MTSYETRRFEGKSAFRDAFQVRHDVFVEEQGVPEDVELDGFDEQKLREPAREARPFLLGATAVAILLLIDAGLLLGL